jgi:hypothetical protein
MRRSRGGSWLTAGTSATVAAKLATADGKTIYICGRTASGGMVAARAITPVTGAHGGMRADKDTSSPPTDAAPERA